MRVASIILLTALSLPGQGEGQAEEKRACVSCHGLRIIHSQRLSRATWERELTKMEGWGTVIRNRPALLDYLVASFGPANPPVEAQLSQDGRERNTVNK